MTSAHALLPEFLLDTRHTGIRLTSDRIAMRSDPAETKRLATGRLLISKNMTTLDWIVALKNSTVKQKIIFTRLLRCK